MKWKFVYVLCTCALSIISMDVSALTYQEVVRDKRDNPVRTLSGDCVRTKEITATDPCHLRIAKYDVIIEEIMGIEERTLYFDFDSSELNETEKYKTQTIADILRKHNIKAIKIVGFADRIGSDDYNHKLSQRRASSVKRHLDSLIKLDSSKIEIRGLGKSHQIEDCTSIKSRDELIDCLAPNRRVEVEVDYKDRVKKVF